MLFPGVEGEAKPMGNLSRLRDWAKKLSVPLIRRKLIGRRRTEIAFESQRVLIVRRLRSTRVWCPACGHDVDMVRPEEAVSLARRNDPQLPEHCISQQWHVAEDTDGTSWVCLESVLKTSFPDLDETGTS